ncbi:MAG: 50S ribosomal protein L13, partial [Planctomycetota bacterium]
MTQKSFLAKPGQVQQKWYAVDASDAVLGRLAVNIARVLMGKHKPEYTPHVDVGDYIIVTNAAKLRVTGEAKQEQRLYDFFSGYPSGLRRHSLGEMLEKKPVDALRL